MTFDGKTVGKKLIATCLKRRGAFLVCREQSPQARILMDALLPDPNRLVATGKPVSSGRLRDATKTVAIEVNEQHYLVKKYVNRGRIFGLKNVFRASKACKSFQMGRLLLASGVPTPLPMIYLEQRRMRMLGDAYLVVPFIPDARNLLDFWPSIPECRRAIVLEDLSCLIGMMHSRGIVHGDLNWRNFLVRMDHEGRAEFFLVDLDGARQLKQPGRKLLADDLKHFRRDMERLEVPLDLQSFFFERWESNVKGCANGFRIRQIMRIG